MDKSRTRITDECYLCGMPATTGDHIPPKGFFPPPRPNNLITVPACQSCNHAFAKDDEAVRAWFSMHLNASPAGEWVAQNKVLPGIFERSPAFRETLLSGIKDVQIETSDGLLDANTYPMDIQRVEGFLIRITKGLLSNYFPQYDRRNAEYTIRHISPTPQNLSQLDSIKDSLFYDFRGDSVLQFRFGITNSGKSGIWMFVFYDCLLFLVAHSLINGVLDNSEGSEQ